MTTKFLILLAVPLAALGSVAQDAIAQDVDAELQAASISLRAGDTAGATEAADAMLRIAPDDPRAIMTAADVYLRCNKPELAVPLYDRYIKLNPQSMPRLWQRGIALFFVGEHQQAAEQFVRHRQVNPYDVENAAWHFLCLAKAESFSKAKQSVLPAPNDPRIPMTEVQQMLIDGKTQSVVKRMEQVPADAPERSSALFYGNFYLGLYADAGGDQETAIAKMSLAAQDAPHHYMGDIARVYAKHLQESVEKKAN